jgi:hypothetical protein
MSKYPFEKMTDSRLLDLRKTYAMKARGTKSVPIKMVIALEEEIKKRGI